MHNERETLRLVLIVVQSSRDKIRARIEVEEHSDSRSPGPFLGASRTKKLYDRIPEGERPVLTLASLCSTGPPFTLPDWVTCEPEIASSLSSLSRIFVERGRFGSLRSFQSQSATELFAVRKSPTLHPTGTLVGGELRLTGINSLKANIFLRYAELSTGIPPGSSTLPLPTVDQTFIVRDRKNEESLLKDLLPHWDGVSATVNVRVAEIDFLFKLEPARWQLLSVANKPVDRVSFTSSPSGIDWFGSEGARIGHSKELLELVLDAYLHDRHFVAFKGRQTFFDEKKIFDQPIKIFASLIGKEEFAAKVESLRQQASPTPGEHKILEASLNKCHFGTILRDYQCDGVIWLKRLRDLQLGGLLADEMGLGKTIQTLAHFLLLQKRIGPFLIVCPASVVPNWKAEILRFLPTIADQAVFDKKEITKDTPLAVVSYHSILKESPIKGIEFDTLVLDEAQMVKNEASQMAAKIRSLNAQHRIVLTGTPLENTVTELWTHASFLNPPLKNAFLSLNRRIPDFSRSPKAAKLSGAFLGPILLRRTKDQVASELPAKTEKDVFCQLSEDEARLYERIRAVFAKALAKQSKATVSSVALEGLLRLRQCCSLPSMVPQALTSKQWSTGSKLELAITLIEDAKKSGRKVLVFTQFAAVLKALASRLQNLGIGYVQLDGSTRDRSQPVREFQTDPNVKVFLIAFRAGGFGINLTAAERVLLYDPWWNPAAEEQAFARAHRIGQKKPVLIQRLICSGTIEEKMLSLRNSKKQLSTAAIESPEKMSITEMKKLLMS